MSEATCMIRHCDRPGVHAVSVENTVTGPKGMGLICQYHQDYIKRFRGLAAWARGIRRAKKERPRV